MFYSEICILRSCSGSTAMYRYHKDQSFGGNRDKLDNSYLILKSKTYVFEFSTTCAAQLTFRFLGSNHIR